MSPTTELILVIGMMVVTFGPRLLPLALADRLELPAPVVRLLRYVPVAVLSAIIVPLALQPRGAIDLSLANAHLGATLVAIVVAAITRNMMATIVVGLVAFAVWRVALGLA